MKFIKKLFKKHKKEKPKSFLITAGNGGNAGGDKLGKNGESIMKDGKSGAGGSSYVGGFVSSVGFGGSGGSGGYAVVNDFYHNCYNCDRLEEELKKSKQELEKIKNLYIN